MGLIPGWASLAAQVVKDPPVMKETWVGSLGWEHPLEKDTGYPLQYSDLENSMDCILHGVAKSWTHVSDFHTEGNLITLETSLKSD